MIFLYILGFLLLHFFSSAILGLVLIPAGKEEQEWVFKWGLIWELWVIFILPIKIIRGIFQGFKWLCQEVTNEFNR